MSNFRNSAAARAYFEVQEMSDRNWERPAKTRPAFADSARASLAVAIALVIGCASVVIILTLGR